MDEFEFLCARPTHAPDPQCCCNENTQAPERDVEQVERETESEHAGVYCHEAELLVLACKPQENDGGNEADHERNKAC